MRLSSGLISTAMDSKKKKKKSRKRVKFTSLPSNQGRYFAVEEEAERTEERKAEDIPAADKHQEEDSPAEGIPAADKHPSDNLPEDNLEKKPPPKP